MQATKPTVGGGRGGVGPVQTRVGGRSFAERGGVVFGGAETKPPRDQSKSPHNAREERVQHGRHKKRGAPLPV